MTTHIIPSAVKSRAKSLAKVLDLVKENSVRSHLAMGIPSLLVFLFLSQLLVGFCQVESTSGEADVAEEEGGLGIVGDGIQDFVDAVLGSAPGVDTVYLFPRNSGKLVIAGEETELLVGINNEGESSIKVQSIKASIHLPFDHRLFVQNLTVQEFMNATVPHLAQATFPYTFTVSKYLQPGSFDLVGSILYELDDELYQTVFYNGTVEVVEANGILSIESVFLVTLGLALVGFFGVWIYGQVQRISNKTKRTAKVEVGTKNTDGTNEWLQGTAFTQKLSNGISRSHKAKKKK